MQRCSKLCKGLEYATVLHYMIEAITFCFALFFSGIVRIAKLVSVSEDFFYAVALLGEEDEPSIVVKETLDRLVCSLYEAKLEIDVNKASSKRKETTITSVFVTYKRKC